MSTTPPTSTRRSRRLGVRAAAAVTALTLLGAACGDDDDTSSADTTAQESPMSETSTMDDEQMDEASDETSDAPAVDTPAADLRVGLSVLLQEHVYLAGIAINQAVADGGDLEAPATAAAVEALDANSQDLAEAIGSVYGDDAGEQFLALWRDHIGFFVDYTLAGATGDTAAQEQARADLDGYRTEFGAFVESATEGELTSDAVAEALTPHVETLFAAIDSVLAGSPEVFADLRAAADHMPMTAEVLAAAIVAQDPGSFGG